MLARRTMPDTRFKCKTHGEAGQRNASKYFSHRIHPNYDAEQPENQQKCAEYPKHGVPPSE
jgi:hypothetical protein